MSNSVRPHRRQPTRFRHPWDSPGKNTGVGCHFLLQCMKEKSESEVVQSCPTLSNPMDCSLPGSSVHGFSRQEYWSEVPLPSPSYLSIIPEICRYSAHTWWAGEWWGQMDRRGLCPGRAPWSEFKSWLCHFQAVWPWGKYLTYLCFHFLVCKMGMLLQYLLHRVARRMM